MGDMHTNPARKGSVQISRGDRDADEAPPDPASIMLPSQWRYFVSARSGEIIAREQLLVSEDVIGQVTGNMRATAPAEPATNVPIEGMTVTITQGGTGFTGETDSAGDYTVRGLAPGSGALNAHLEGSRLRVFNDETAAAGRTARARVLDRRRLERNVRVDLQ